MGHELQNGESPDAGSGAGSSEMSSGAAVLRNVQLVALSGWS
jgi:hypothetical protein